MEAEQLTVKKFAQYFLFLLPLSAAAFFTVVQMNLPRDMQTDVICGLSVFLSVSCIGVVFYRNWKVFARQLAVALAGGAIAFGIMQLI